MQTNDELWKGALEDFAPGFLLKAYPKMYPYIDFDHPEPIVFLDKELERLHGDSEIGTKRVDKLMGVRLRGMSDMKILYIHVEVQGYQDNEFERRNFIYFYRLFDLYGDNVTMIGIFTDGNASYRPSVFEHRFMGVELTYKYPIYKIMDEDPVKLAASDNPFDAVILAAYWAIQKKNGRLTDEDLVDLKIDLMKRLLFKNMPKDKIRRLFDFINLYVRFDKPEIAATFERRFDELNKIEKGMGITEILLRQGRDEAAMLVQEARAETQAAQQAAQQAELAARLAEERERQVIKMTVSNMRKRNYSLEAIADIAGYDLDLVKVLFKELDDENASL